MRKLLLAAGISLALASPAAANMFSFSVTGTGSDGALAASADVTTNNGSIDIVLRNTLNSTDIHSAGQTLSDFMIVLDSSAGTLLGRTATGQLANIDGGTAVNVAGDPLRWVGLGTVPPDSGTGTFSITGGGTIIYMSALGGGQPSQLLLPTGTDFSGACSLVCGQFDPFVVSGPLAIHLDLSGVTTFTGINSVEFSFGTGPETRISTVPGPIVGAGLPGLIMALGGMIGLNRYRRKRQVA